MIGFVAPFLFVLPHNLFILILSSDPGSPLYLQLGAKLDLFLKADEDEPHCSKDKWNLPSQLKSIRIHTDVFVSN